MAREKGRFLQIKTGERVEVRSPYINGEPGKVTVMVELVRYGEEYTKEEREALIKKYLIQPDQLKNVAEVLKEMKNEGS